MKVIKIEIHEMPNDYGRPVVEMVDYPKLNPKVFNEADTIDYSEQVNITKELYPLRGLALGRYREWFYIREKDSKLLKANCRVLLIKQKVK